MVAPAAPKQAIVATVGVLPGRLTMISGSSPPVIRPIAAEYLYLNFWYKEKDVVRTRVTLNIGARAPGKHMHISDEYPNNELYIFAMSVGNVFRIPVEEIRAMIRKIKTEILRIVKTIPKEAV